VGAGSTGVMAVKDTGKVVTSVSAVEISPGPVVSTALGMSVGDCETAVLGFAETMLVVTTTHSSCGTILSLIKVTAPLSAYSPPLTLTLSRSEIEVRASMLPLNLVELPKVADDPIWNNTLQARAPSIKTTDADEAVVRVEPI
jgi:hypothetical protein